LSRNEAYDKAQEIAFKSRKSGGTFKETVLADDGIRSLLSADEIEQVFDYKHYVRNVDKIFGKVGI